MKATKHDLKHIDHELIQLKEAIQENLRHCKEANQAKLHHARMVGKDLIKAKKLFSTNRGNWTIWLRNNFALSQATARVYMRVAREWNHPDVIEHRNDGMAPMSIQSFLDIVTSKSKSREVDDLSGDPENNPFVVDPPEIKEAKLRDWLNSLFRTSLRDLDLTELEFFEFYFNKLWETLQDELKDLICKALEYDPYDDSNQLRKEVAERIKQARLRRQSRLDNRKGQLTKKDASVPPLDCFNGGVENIGERGLSHSHDPEPYPDALR